MLKPTIILTKVLAVDKTNEDKHLSGAFTQVFNELISDFTLRSDTSLTHWDENKWKNYKRFPPNSMSSAISYGKSSLRFFKPILEAQDSIITFNEKEDADINVTNFNPLDDSINKIEVRVHSPHLVLLEIIEGKLLLAYPSADKVFKPFFVELSEGYIISSYIINE